MTRRKVRGTRLEVEGPAAGEQGFMLLGLIVAIAIILMVLGIAASKMAFSLRRERELESARRADQYVRAIRRFYLKNKLYPTSLKQLENTNQVRYLRQEYVDPLTGKADYRLIAVGQNKTTVKGFFGQPLAGIASTGLGALAGSSAGMGGVPGAGAGGIAGAGGAGAGAGAGIAAGVGTGAGAGGGVGTGAGAGATGSPGAGGATDNSGLGGSSGFGSSTGAGGQSGGLGALGGTPGPGPIMGVGSNAQGNSIIVVNEQTTYQTWEFLYDPRVELLKAQSALNGGLGSVSGSALGQGTGTSGFGSGSGGLPGQTQGGTGGPVGPGAGQGATTQPGGVGTTPTQP